MRIVLHFPKTDSEQALLEDRVASFHAEFVLEYLEKLDCPEEQKKQLRHRVLRTLRKTAKSADP